MHVPERYQCNPKATKKEEPREFTRARSKVVWKDNDVSFASRIDCPICKAKKADFCQKKEGRAGQFCRARLLAGWKLAWGGEG